MDEQDVMQYPRGFGPVSGRRLADRTALQSAIAELDPKYHEYMRSYSPIQQVRAGATYPAMLLCSGLNDPRVAYWEPAKWTARLRARKTDSNPLLLKIDLGSGHFSASDRYKYLREYAFEYAFMLDQVGLL